MKNRIIRLPEIKQRIGLSRSTIYARISEGTFPTQVPLGGRAVGWLDSEIDQWITEQIDTRSGGDSDVS
jgi:prophage regulatory protein